MAADNKITTLKFENKLGVLLHPNYWLAGVDYKEKNEAQREHGSDARQGLTAGDDDHLIKKYT